MSNLWKASSFVPLTALSSSANALDVLPPSVKGARRSFAADVNVEHVRSQWKTYGNLQHYVPGKYHIKTFNKISPEGLKRFPSESYDVSPDAANAHAILLRSHKLKEEEVPHTVRAIAR
jgi:D-3-phosphoglycerate dehydrogenase